MALNPMEQFAVKPLIAEPLFALGGHPIYFTNQALLMIIVVIASSLFGSTFALAAEPAQQGHVAPQPQKAARPTLDVVFVLDTTGSMSGLIEGAKQKIWSIASRLASGTPAPRIRVGLVAYRDRGDEYVTRRFELSEDLDAVYANLQGFSAAGGGDGPEHVGQALGEAVSLMQWGQDPKTARMITSIVIACASDRVRSRIPGAHPSISRLVISSTTRS